MSTQGLESLEHTVQLTHIWVNELDERMQWNNKARSYRLLKAVLHALRDSLQVSEAADLGAQLPGLLRGAYYEQWRPAAKKLKHRDVEAFLKRVSQSFERDPLDDPAMAVMVVFHFLTTKVTEGEIDDVRRCLPESIRDIWPTLPRESSAPRH